MGNIKHFIKFTFGNRIKSSMHNTHKVMSPQVKTSAAKEKILKGFLPLLELSELNSPSSQGWSPYSVIRTQEATKGKREKIFKQLVKKLCSSIPIEGACPNTAWRCFEGKTIVLISI